MSVVMAMPSRTMSASLGASLGSRTRVTTRRAIATPTPSRHVRVGSSSSRTTFPSRRTSRAALDARRAPPPRGLGSMPPLVPGGSRPSSRPARSIDRCAKCDAFGKMFGDVRRPDAPEMRECCRKAAGLDQPSRGRVALGAAAVGGVATAAYVAYGGGGGGRVIRGKGYGGGGGGDSYSTRVEATAAASFEENAGAPPVGWLEEVVMLDVRGMHCGGCAANVRRILEAEGSCVSAAVNLANESALVRVGVDVGEAAVAGRAGQDASFEDAVVRAVRAVGDALAETVTEKGFPTTVREACGVAVAGVSAADAAGSKREERLRRIAESTKRVVVAWALAATCLIGHAAHAFHHSAPWLKVFCSTPVHAGLSVFALLGPGRETLVDGWRSLRAGGPNMNTLVSLGALASFGMSTAAVMLPKLGWPTFFEEPVMLLAFVLLGRAVEERAKLRATSDMSALLNLLPPTARLLPRGGGGGAGAGAGAGEAEDYYRTVPTSVIQPDDLILVLPGDRVPVDGVVVRGTSQVDEAAINGEPIPRAKSAGDDVSAGTVNCDGALTVRVVSSGEETQVAGIVRMVEAAQQREAPVQRLADEVSGKFVYGVMGASAATFAFWSTVGTKIFPQVLANGAVAGVNAPLLLGLQMAASVLVVACPCALGLATPTAVLVGTSLGARHGLLIRGGDVLERTHTLDTVVFDKTGTLTVGRPAVKRAVVADGLREEDVLAMAAAVERNSRHPLALAVAAAAEASPSPRLSAAEDTFRQEPGAGASAVVDGVVVAVGTKSFASPSKPVPDAIAAHTRTVHPGRTPVYVSYDGEIVGVLEMEDAIRPESASTMSRLKKRGVRVVLLSGDRQETAESVGLGLGMAREDIYGDVRPEGKAALIQKLQDEGRRVAMVGDGINDAAALACADVGVAMAGGVGAASEVASIVLLGDNPEQVVDSIELSKATFGKIKQNLGWAFAYNAVGIPIAAGALLPFTGLALTPSVAGGLMGFSSLGVMANSLLLRLTSRKLSKMDDAKFEAKTNAAADHAAKLALAGSDENA